MSPLLDRDQAIGGGEAERGLRRAPAHPGPRGDGVHAQAAGITTPHLRRNDAQNRALAFCEAGGQGGR